ncbi:hypothetical protein KQ51_01542 [Candidatus Izimaplasma bacterium HR1]|jgi:hypothetical protein|uniref:hypothetical protein n=1 Tax=Candidatus Izimoplasma sp. HR1 TaxID=1541959 RepID=UPI0004F91550|nr:hypothetical protein KQ51_01542 [Candidatus Izimaplasma bacterium HR1]
MYELMKRKYVSVIVIVSVFCYFTRTVDLISAVLLFVLISNRGFVSAKKVLTNLSIGYMGISVILGLYRLVMLLTQMQVFSTSIRTRDIYMVYSIVGLVSVFIMIAMALIYFIMERKYKLDKLFLFVLTMPLIGGVLIVIDGYVINKIYNYFLDLNRESGFGFGTINFGPNNLITVTKFILLVYLIMKPKFNGVLKEHIVEE